MHAAAQRVEELRYKPEVAGLIPGEVIGIFFIDLILPGALSL